MLTRTEIARRSKRRHDVAAMLTGIAVGLFLAAAFIASIMIHETARWSGM